MKQLIASLIIILFTTSASAQDRLRLAVTTSFHNSGLADVLLPVVKADLNLEVQLLVVGTGQAIKLGQQGDVDAILVHSRTAEEAFVTQGYGAYRREIMYNDFVIIGPHHDPANIKATASARDALRSIAQTQATFVSRGDDSGTHKKERALWEQAELDAAQFGTWYRSVGSGMGTALNTAAAMNAYILTDRASWLNFANKGELSILYQGDPVLFNQYAFLPVSAERHPHVKTNLVKTLETWLVSETAQRLIDGYQINGETLFTFNGVASN